MATPVQRALSASVAVSAALHLGLGVLVAASGSEPDHGGRDDPSLLLIDVDVAPPPPEAFDPAEASEASEPVPESPEKEPEPAATVEPAPEPEPEPEEALAPPDAGTELAAADAGALDAGAFAEADRDAAPVAEADRDAAPVAEADRDAAPVAEADRDAAPVAEADRDAAPVAEADRDAGAEIASAETSPFPRGGRAGVGAPAAIGSKPDQPADRPAGQAVPAGAAADFRPYLPEGDFLAVLLRLDRLRDTPWAGAVDQLLGPMPDYQRIIGDRDRRVADLFDVLFISSSDPSDVTATNLAAKSSMPAREMRDFLDHKRAPVAWSATRGGALGRPRYPQRRRPRDDRVYLMPFSGWTLLTKPRNLGVLTQKRAGAVGAASARDSDLPPWVAKLREVEAQSGLEEQGPVVVAGFHSLPESIHVPLLGLSAPGPERASVALELATTTGFLVRGTLVFSDEHRAASFARTLAETRRKLLHQTVWTLALKRFNLYNALKGLSTRRRGSAIAFATSVSNADAKAAIEKIAAVAQRFYEQNREERRP